MTTDWEVEPWSPTRVRRLAAVTGIALVAYVAVIHSAAVVVGGVIAVAIVALIVAIAVGLVAVAGRRARSRALRGALFAGRGTVPVASLGSHLRFAALVVGARPRVAVDVAVGSQGWTLTPRHPTGAAALPVAWSEVAALLAAAMPGQVFAGFVDLTLDDGSTVQVTVRHYRALAAALQRIHDGV
jgi:hypothetical protein